MRFRAIGHQAASDISAFIERSSSRSANHGDALATSLGIHFRPNVIAEVEDAALMNHFGAEGLGFIPVYSAVLPEVTKMYDLKKFGVVRGQK